MKQRSGQFGPNLSNLTQEETAGIAFRSRCFECGRNLRRHMAARRENTIEIEKTDDGRSKFVCSKCTGITPEKFDAERDDWKHTGVVDVTKDH